MIAFFIPGDPVPQGRPRAYKMGAKIGMFDPAESKAWKRVVAQVAGLQRNRWHDGPLKVSLVFLMKKPKSMSIQTKHHVKKPDVDNLAKAVLDGLNGVCFTDDSQIVELSVTKKYTMMDGNTGVSVGIECVE